MTATTSIDWTDVKTLIGSQLVKHECFDYALERAVQLTRHNATDGGPVGLALVGDSRAGKTTIFKAMEQAMPSHRLADGLRKPFFYVKVPQKPTVMGLAEAILQALGDPKANRGTKINKTLRVKTLLRATETLVLGLDDLQHFVDKTTQAIQYEASDWLKEIMDETPINLLVNGLPSCLKVIRANEQLRGRFMRPITLKRFDWNDESDRKDFVGVLRQWRELLSMVEMPPIDEESMAFRFYCASGGLMGYNYKILRQAVWNAADADTPRITLEDLEYAHLEAVDAGDHADVSPFSTNFDVTNIPAQVEKAKVIGVHVEPPEPPKPSGGEAGREGATSASDAFRDA